MVNHTAKEVVGKLKEQGFINDHVTGDHHIFVNSTGKKIVVPYSRLKDSIATGTYKAILRQLEK